MKKLYTIADYWHFPSNEKVNMFLSAFSFQKFAMVFLLFGMFCNQKQANINHHGFYLVTPCEIKSYEK